MKTVINEMLCGIAIKSALIIAFSAALLSVPVCAYAAGNSSTDATKVYDSDYEEWLHGYRIDIIEYHAFEFEGITYYIPLYREEEQKVYSHYFVNKNNGYVFDEEIITSLCHPALEYLIDYAQYHCQDTDTIVYSYYEYYARNNPDKYKDVEVMMPAVPVFNLSGYQNSSEYNEDYKDYLYYIATGAVPADMDRNKVTLPDGWTIGEDGVPREGNNELIFHSEGGVHRGNEYQTPSITYTGFPFDKRVFSCGDDKMCFYLDSSQYESDSVLFVYKENITINDSINAYNYENISTSFYPEINGDISIDTNFDIMITPIANGMFVLYDDLYSHFSSHSGGGGHFGTGSDTLNSIKQYVSSCFVGQGYPIVVNGKLKLGWVERFLGQDLILSAFSRALYISADILSPNLSSLIDDLISSNDSFLVAETVTVTRPIFKNKITAQEWYSTSHVGNRELIHYIPDGYFYHSDTCILDKNPLAEDEAETSGGMSNVGTGTFNFDKTINNTTNNNTNNTTNNSYITSGQGVTVIVNQTNNNNQTNEQTNDNNQNVTVPAGNGSVEDGFPMDDIGDGLSWMTSLTGSLRGTSDSDKDSSVSSGAVDAESFTDLLGGTFNFLPAAFTTLLLIGLVGAVLLRFLGR